VTDDQVAAGWQGIHERRDDAVRVVLVGNQLEDAEHHQRDRTGQVQDLRRVGEDPLGDARIGVEVGARAFGAAGQQRPRVQQHHRIVVDVDDAAVGGDLLGHLVRVVSAGQSRTDVEVLPYPSFARQVPNGADEERAVRPHPMSDVRVQFEGAVSGFPVDSEVVLAAQPVVVDPCLVRDARIDVPTLIRCLACVTRHST
jgi:hypothetical protein